MPTESTDSSDTSYESWHGIKGLPVHHVLVVQPLQNLVVQAPVIVHDAADYYPPPPSPPSPSIPGSEPGHFPFSDHGNGSHVPDPPVVPLHNTPIPVQDTIPL